MMHPVTTLHWWAFIPFYAIQTGREIIALSYTQDRLLYYSDARLSYKYIPCINRTKSYLKPYLYDWSICKSHQQEGGHLW